jgi:hypothetical protein
MHKSGGRQPAVVTVTRLQRGTVSLGAMMVVIKSGGCQPAVGAGNTIAQTQARLFCRPPTVYVRIAVAFTVIVTTGGLRPPLLYCDADVRRHKKRFLRCKNAHAQERRASARRGFERRTCNGERFSPNGTLASHSHNWLTPAAPGRVNGVPLLMCVSDRQVRYVWHGWLTPTALGARRYIPSGNSDICGVPCASPLRFR